VGAVSDPSKKRKKKQQRGREGLTSSKERPKRDKSSPELARSATRHRSLGVVNTPPYSEKDVKKKKKK